MKKIKFLLFACLYTLVLIILAMKISTGLVRNQNKTNQDYFYRNTKELAKKGIGTINLNEDQKEEIHEAIRSFYGTAYRDKRKEFYENQIAKAESQEEKDEYLKKVEALQNALISPPRFSEPLVYKDLDGYIGILAVSNVYIKGDKIGGEEPYIFFFQESESQDPVLKKVISVTESWRSQELDAVQEFREELNKKPLE